MIIVLRDHKVVGRLAVQAHNLYTSDTPFRVPRSLSKSDNLERGIRI